MLKMWWYFNFGVLQGMVEVVAENYHNIWAKKKKTELISKGAQMESLKTHLTSSLHILVEICVKCMSLSFDVTFQEEGPIPCWFPMTPWQLKRSTEIERRPRSSSSFFRSVDMLSQGLLSAVLKVWSLSFIILLYVYIYSILKINI